MIPNTNRVPNSRIELRIRCSHLKNLDIVSKSDPVVNLFTKRGANYTYVGCTEKINNNLNPEFKTPIIIDYFFEEVQNLRFTCLDIDGEVKILSGIDENDTIGSFETTLGNILSRPGRRVVGELKHKGKTTGNIEVTAEELQNTNHDIYLRMEASNVDAKDWNGKSDPYFKIYKAVQGGSAPALVYQSEIIKNTLNPVWRPVQMSLESFNGGDMFRDLTIEVFDYDSIGSHDLIGIVHLNADQVLRGQKEFPIINPKKTKKSGYNNSGILRFFEAKLEKKHSFLDYLAGGCEISLMVAIDCTGSNGVASNVHSLHYNTPAQPSQYARSIMSVGSVLAPYDSDGMIDVMGFGGSYPGSGVSHCFPFSFDPNVPAALGVQGVLGLYNQNIEKIYFSGPTNFSEVIQHAMKKASEGQNQQNQKYTVLLILTDGEISDMDETVRNLVSASTMPLSVVIVGVGSSSFDNMVTLDGDDGTLKDYNGRKASRDIVQFVPFTSFSSNIDLLAQETLKEIPGQLLSFFKTVGFAPNPPRQFVAQPIITPIPPPIAPQ
ncbi:hypothetical protein DICPUDRAFT_56392 [Dictyostelium purpureum]|uniref:C2 domain-containing protein n=1 Tax=Dictyostelium purpureum TaxID=5786 RepID=F0ZRA2_DICPU|nr:uncharacterized protein DICPUDRAFT_56392 [Dictyostelium purpureum]EGC33517.1 hypothetical protein DICPUDRAFT_56392 [Dictyostelium purpureum]|eukprot:XP_003289942.1 hypothetical protein DICPUDRAFT_56392 [Dictyostelium purpureum]